MPVSHICSSVFLSPPFAQQRKLAFLGKTFDILFSLVRRVSAVRSTSSNSSEVK